ncbi:MAG: hypothetical protein CVT89_00215 [Candidatus Altiarchaeales archaeon HGW-Altiarchaeales-2]|nr:MAG: hypothetical protein CVT89_00215 [Candidatus Altiarchaeales archaeon HGW-Altiarchaeales-2]
MDDKKYKSREEWKEVINCLSPGDFQQLCYDIISKNGFKNPKLRGGGADGGRDIEAEFGYVIAGKEDIREKCWFQCKRQKQGVSFSQITTEVQKAEDQGIIKFFILSNLDTTPDCKEDIQRWNEKHRCRILDWTGITFQDLLFPLPDVCRYYFPDEELPPMVDAKAPGEVISKSLELGNRFDVRLELKIDKEVNLNNPSEVADFLKEALLKLTNIDVNLRALIYQKISMLFFGIEKSEDAIMFLNMSLDITPNNIEALLKKGYILEKIDEIEESNKCYDEILKNDGKNKFALNNKASNLRRIGQYDEALVFIDKALETDHNFIAAIINKANILKGLKKSKEALAFLDGKNSILQKSINLQTTKVDLCIELLDLREAYLVNEEIRNKNPNYTHAINSKGVIFERNSKFQKRDKYLSLALECFENVIQEDNKYPIGWSNKVVVFVNSGNIDEAEKIIDIAYTMFPKDPHVLNKKGLVLLCKTNHRSKDALKYFDKALKLLFQEEFLLNKAQAQLNLRQWIQAKETAEILLKYNPEKSEGWTIKGHALRQLHQITMADICFKNAEKFKEKPISLLEDIKDKNEQN